MNVLSLGLLADRAPKAKATVLAHTGKPFDAASIGSAMATRAIMADLHAGMDGPLGGSGGAFSEAGPQVGAVGAGGSKETSTVSPELAPSCVALPGVFQLPVS